jgi:chromosome segregation ATPase
MSKVTIWKRDVAEEMKKAYKSKAAPNIKGYILELTLNDDILDALEEENDHVTPQRMVEDAQELCEDTVKELNTKLRELDAKVDGKSEDEVDKARDDFEKLMEKEIRDLGNELKKVPAARWAKFIATKKKYKDYKIDCGFKITLGTLGAIGSGLAIAAAVPTGGASLALGIVGGIRSGVAMAKLCHDLYKEMETVQDSVEKNLKTLLELYKSRAKLAVSETGATMINTIFGADFVPNVGKVDKDVELWQNKLAGVDVNGHKLGAQAMKVIKDVDKLQEMIKKSASKKAGEIMTKIQKLQKELDKLLQKTTDMNARVAPSEKAVEAAEQVVEELNKKIPNLQKAFNTLFPIVASLSLAGANAGVGFQEASGALDYVNTSLGLADDLLSTVNDATE